ncbi:MAG TPA: DUF418 domain-containing protein [Bryobacteraceae bacterium]|nr:DUF418 domain-containing protein [Bryobacteraceae bacterium]
MDNSPGPISASERILYIDILRGMALFGILAANMRGFDAPASVYGNIKILFHGRADMIAQAFNDIFIQGKFVTLFSFLFGLGFAVQLSRAEARGAKFMSFYPRRLAALALFGLIHGLLIWWGDILLAYALAGTLLLLLRNRSQKTLLWSAGSIFCLPVLVMTGLAIAGFLGHGPFRAQPVKPPDMAKINSVITIYSHGSVPQILRENLVIWKQQLSDTSFGFYAVSLFLLGMWVWRSGIVNRLDEYKPVLMRVCAWCIPVGLALNTFVTLANLRPPTGKPTLIGYFAAVLDLPAAHILSAGYAAGLAVLIQNPAWRRRLTPFAAVGRMALTNYLAESVLCTVFFYNYTTGLYGRVGPAVDLIPTVVLYGSQVLFSNWWLARYRFGPMEWLWRGMTYGKLPTMRKQPEVVALPLADAAAGGEG